VSLAGIAIMTLMACCISWSRRQDDLFHGAFSDAHWWVPAPGKPIKSEIHGSASAGSAGRVFRFNKIGTGCVCRSSTGWN